MTRRPTILDVARQAGVSKSTVSLVLRNSPLVKPDTARVVRAAMEEVGYVYNRAAAQLRSTGVGLIGLVINDLRNPFFTEFAASVQMDLARHGYATVLSNTDEDPALQDQVIGSMIEHGVSGIILSPAYGGDGAIYDRIGRAGIPALQVLRHAGPFADAMPFASFDYQRGGRLATQHLVEQGARRIAFVGGVEGLPITQERLEGYLDVMQGEGLAPLHLSGRATRRFGRRMAEAITRDHGEVDAAFCFNDLTALGLLSGLSELGRPAGREVRVVGFDDIEESAQAFPALSSVACDIAAFGARMAEAMRRWLEEGERPPAEYRAEVSLVPRASSLGGL